MLYSAEVYAATTPMPIATAAKATVTAVNITLRKPRYVGRLRMGSSLEPGIPSTQSTMPMMTSKMPTTAPPPKMAIQLASFIFVLSEP